jgi:hypothetical protein
MVSDTKITERIRRAKRASNGRDQKRARTKAGTPKFPIHLEPATPEAKKA